MSLACLAHVNYLQHMYFDLITEQINDDDDDDECPVSPHLTISHTFHSTSFNSVNECSMIGYLSNSWTSCL